MGARFIAATVRPLSTALRRWAARYRRRIVENLWLLTTFSLSYLLLQSINAYELLHDMSRTFVDFEAVNLYEMAIALVPTCVLAVFIAARHAAKTRKAQRELRASLAQVEELYERQAALRLQADQANVEKSAFLANMSHEMRTPLNGVTGMAQLLQRTELTQKQRKFADTILASSQALTSLINDILDLSKIEASITRLDMDWCDVHTIAESAMALIEEMARQKNLELIISIAPDAEVDVKCDENRLRQILINMLGNAVKFTDRGRIRLEISRRADGNFKFAVCDDGPGVPGDQQARIFERFYQMDGSNTRKHGGTGLGLAICRDLANLMGGDIGVDSVVGEGATFWLILPLEQASRHVKKSGQAVQRREAPQTDNIAVLVAEDGPVNQIVIREALAQLGFRNIVIAENGQEALDCLRASHFDLVLMDIQMPVMDGDEATRRIRASGAAYAGIPILVLTANAMSEQRDRYLACGADECLVKPIDLAELEAKLRKHIRPPSEGRLAPADRTNVTRAIA